MAVKDIAMRLMGHTPTPPPTHGLRVHTAERRQALPLPFLAYEYRAEDGSLASFDTAGLTE